MAVRLADFGLEQLSTEERLLLVQELWDSIARDSAVAPLSTSQREEIDRRLAAHQASPENVISWETIRNEALDNSH